MGNKVLIVGGVAGGASTAARLRRLDENAEIIMFERGEYISYANCGLPYYIGDVIVDRDALLLQTPEIMGARFNIDVRVQNEVLSIDKEKKEVEVKNHATGETYKESYDTLVLSTGSSPLKPPIEGIDSPNIFTLWTVPDTDDIKGFCELYKPKRAAVIGGGFIGLEMAENFHNLGMEVSLIEMLDQVMAPLDYEMSQILHENMRMNDVNLVLGDGVKDFKYNNGVTTITLQSGKQVEADIVILSIGVKPNSGLAKEAGLEINPRGGVIVDDYLKTSDKDIFALGDMIEVEDFTTKERTMIPLAGPANKQGRICANNIVGGKEKYKGTQGTAVAKVFDMSAACSGINEKTLQKQGKVANKDYFTAMIYQKSHAGYYPGAAPLALKMIFEKDGKILGGQVVGQSGVDKRMDTLATTMRLGGSIYDLKELELSYAPPFSSAKDPVNMLGFVAENILTEKVAFTAWNELNDADPSKVTVLDVSEPEERMAGVIPNSINIPLGELRGRLSELDKNKEIVVYCAIGVRSYVGQRALANNGFKNTKVYPGGFSFYKSAFHQEMAAELDNINVEVEAPKTMSVGNITGEIKASLKVDCNGLQCPGPIMKVFKTIQEINEGDIIEVCATDAGFARDVDAWCRRTGNTMLKTEKNGKEIKVFMQKGVNMPTACNISGTETPAFDGKTMVVFSGDLDKVLASFIIANGAASMGRKVTMFFTFWGLNSLRKPENVKVRKPIIDAMFGKMMPRGSSNLTLSKMHMGGMGTAMMKKVMNDKNVDSLEVLMKQAMDNGVKMIACTMSMDIMGITKDELVDGIDYAGVATYLADAEESNVNLFI